MLNFELSIVLRICIYLEQVKSTRQKSVELLFVVYARLLSRSTRKSFPVEIQTLLADLARPNHPLTKDSLTNQTSVKPNSKIMKLEG